MTARRVEVLVIGAGPGGYAAAIRLGRLGKKVTLVDKEFVGGVCLNAGCIPSKALITAAKTFEKMRQAGSMGIHAESVSVDLERMQEWKQGIVERLSRGIRQLCKHAGVELILGHASFAGERKLKIASRDGEETLEAENVLIATGSRAGEIPGFSFDGKLIISSTEALELKRVPSQMVVIGGGYIGMELGMMYSKLGARVTLVEMLDQLLPGFPEDIVQVITRRLKKQGIDYHVSARARGWEKCGEGVRVQVETPQGELSLPAELVLLTVGRRPNLQGLQLEKTGLAVDERGFLPVNSRLQTQVPGIYAIGDAVGNPMLAHKSSKEAEVAAEVIAGKRSELDYAAIPAVVFTDPEIATVGLSEKEAAERGFEVLIGRFPFAASGRAMTTLETEGFVKIVADKSTRRVLGVHIVGPEASDLISEGALALEMGAHLEDIAHTIHPHPTLSESLMEAAQQALGEAVHVMNS